MKKPANGLADWTRSEPTTAGIAERSADWRRRLRWAGAAWSSTRPDQDGGAEIVFDDVATRGGTLTSSLRSEPRSFNRLVAQRRSRPTSTRILTGSKLVRVNRATQEVEPALAENVDDLARQPDLHADAARRRDLVGRHAVHVRRRPVHASRRSTTRRSTACWPASLTIDGKPLTGHRARCAHRGRHLPGTVRSRASRLLDNVPIVPKHKLRGGAQGRHVRAGAGRRRRRRPTSSSIGPFMLTPLRAGAAAGLRSQPALLEEGRGRRSSCRISIR